MSAAGKAQDAGQPEAPGTVAAYIWRELASGRCRVLLAADCDGSRHLVLALTRNVPATDWSVLSNREARIVALAARGLAQKVIAIEIRSTPSRVSATLRDVRERLGFARLVDLVMAYRALR